MFGFTQDLPSDMMYPSPSITIYQSK